MNKIDHLLSKHNILSAFNIIRKINKKELNKMRQQLETTCKDEAELETKLHKFISSNMKDYTIKKNIPGIIIESDTIKSKTKNSVKDNNTISNKNLSDKKSTKKSLIEKDFHNLPDEKQKSIIAISSQIIAHCHNFNLNTNDIFFFIQIILSELKISSDDMNALNKKYFNVTGSDADDDGYGDYTDDSDNDSYNDEDGEYYDDDDDDDDDDDGNPF
jgi:regulator of RNase E activity RraB